MIDDKGKEVNETTIQHKVSPHSIKVHKRGLA